MASQPSSESHVDWSDSSQHCQLYLQQNTASTLELANSAFVSKQTTNYSATSWPDSSIHIICHLNICPLKLLLHILRDQQLLRAQLSCEVSTIYTRNFLLRLYEFHVRNHILIRTLAYKSSSMIQTASHATQSLPAKFHSYPLNLTSNPSLGFYCKVLVYHTNQLTIPFNPFLLHLIARR